MLHTAKAGSPLRLGVVGVGVMGSNHARVIADLADVKLAGIADTDARQRDYVSRALGCASSGLSAVPKLVRRNIS